MKKALKILGVLVVLLIVAALGFVAYLKLALPNTGAAPQLKVAGTPEQIARGEYLANHVAVCMDCHSTRDWSRFSGPVVPGTLGRGGEEFPESMGFPGTFYSPNITSHNVGTWTDGELFRAITSGVTKDGEPLFPLMPYFYYGHADPADIQAIIAYIRTLPAQNNPSRASQPKFPFSLIERTIPKPGNPVVIPAPSDSVAYGGYLVNLAGCKECHTKVDDKAQLIAGTEFGGGRAFPLPGNFVVHTANLTPDATGLGPWTREQFIQYFKQYLSPELVTKVEPGGKNTIMPWTMYAGMTEADLSCIYQFLRTLKPINNKVEIYSAK